MTLVAPDDAALAGYRLTRVLGRGSRADVYLGTGSTGAVALKVFKPDVSRESIGIELDAVGRLHSPHLLRLLDLGRGRDDRPVLILERVHRGSVSTLLRDRNSLEPGEVVTLLAPLAGALPEMHREGVAHGRIGAASVHFGANGAPVLIGFGHCELFAAGGSIASIGAQPAAARDRHALAAFAIALLGRVRDATVDPRVARLIEWIDGAPREYEFVERLEGRLFDFADPMPISLRSATTVSASLPPRMGLVRSPSLPAPAPGVDGGQLRDRRSHRAEPSGLLGRLDVMLRQNPLDAAKSRILLAAKGVRKRFWVAASVVVVALVATIAMLPQGAAPAAVPVPTRTPDAALPSSIGLVLPDDPVAAIPLLFVARTACVRELSVQCLDAVDDQSSAAFGADATLIEQLQGGTEIPKSAILAALAPRLIESLGNSAIVSLGAKSNPASVLMIKTKAGWRIRSYLSGVQATASPPPAG